MKRMFFGIIGTVLGAGAGWTALNAISQVGQDSFLRQLTAPIGGVSGLIFALLLGRRVKRRLR